MSARASLFALLLAASLAPATASAGSWIGDTTSGYAFVGGGGGLGDGLDGTGGGRFALGVGAYTIALYVGAELDVTFTPSLPFGFAGVGTIGIHIPLPVVHPMFGLRGGGGLSTDGSYFGPTGVAGGQIGMIIREFDGRFGVRFMIDADAVFFKDASGLLANTPDGHRVFPQLMGTVAFVW